HEPTGADPRVPGPAPRDARRPPAPLDGRGRADPPVPRHAADPDRQVGGPRVGLARRADARDPPAHGLPRAPPRRRDRPERLALHRLLGHPAAGRPAPLPEELSPRRWLGAAPGGDPDDPAAAASRPAGRESLHHPEGPRAAGRPLLVRRPGPPPRQ